jgi:hypothetical protein
MSKSEANPKSEIRIKIGYAEEISFDLVGCGLKPRSGSGTAHLEIRRFGFPVCFDFRISGFGFLLS